MTLLFIRDAPRSAVEPPTQEMMVAAVAISDALALVSRMPSDPSLEEFARWQADVQDAVHEVSRTAPYGRTTRPVIELFHVAVGVPFRMEAGPAGERVVDLGGYREALRDSLLHVNERMSAGPTTDLSEALRIVLDAFPHRDARELGELLGVRPPAVRRLRQGLRSRVTEERVLAIAELVEELTFADRPRYTQWHWFWSQNADLDGRRPIDLLEENPAGARQQLVSAARH
ncbi:MAG: hypothetical protein F2817_01730 [Actinobacteria bacterium]|jgi:hypothetical protein|nr:hypothetical protein [Actinomycetota bacterium]